jgi:hypothetical protein
MSEFKLFGFGRAGLPDDVDFWLTQDGEVERLAREAIRACTASGDRRRRSPGDQWATIVFMLVAWHNKRKEQAPPVVLDALAHVLGLVSPDTGASTASTTVKGRIGLPTKVEMWKLESYLLASRLDGEADASGGPKLNREVLGEELGVGARTLDGWRKQPEYKRRRAFVRALGSQVPVPRGGEAQRRWIQEQLAQ